MFVVVLQFFFYLKFVCKIRLFVDNTKYFHTKCENTVTNNQNNICMINHDARKKMTPKNTLFKNLYVV